MSRITPPFDFYTEADGSPLENGKIYIGVAGLNPVTSPVQAYSDEALTQKVAQPIRTVAGYPISITTNAPIRLFVEESQHSIAIYNKNSEFIFQLLKP